MLDDGASEKQTTWLNLSNINGELYNNIETDILIVNGQPVYNLNPNLLSLDAALTVLRSRNAGEKPRTGA